MDLCHPGLLQLCIWIDFLDPPYTLHSTCPCQRSIVLGTARQWPHHHHQHVLHCILDDVPISCPCTPPVWTTNWVWFSHIFRQWNQVEGWTPVQYMIYKLNTSSWSQISYVLCHSICSISCTHVHYQTIHLARAWGSIASKCSSTFLLVTPIFHP